MSETITTAAALIAYRKELLDGKMPHEIVDQLVLQAGHALVSDIGLGVKSDA